MISFNKKMFIPIPYFSYLHDNGDFTSSRNPSTLDFSPKGNILVVLITGTLRTPGIFENRGTIWKSMSFLIIFITPVNIHKY